MEQAIAVISHAAAHTFALMLRGLLVAGEWAYSAWRQRRQHVLTTESLAARPRGMPTPTLGPKTVQPPTE